MFNECGGKLEFRWITLCTILHGSDPIYIAYSAWTLFNRKWLTYWITHHNSKTSSHSSNSSVSDNNNKLNVETHILRTISFENWNYYHPYDICAVRNLISFWRYWQTGVQNECDRARESQTATVRDVPKYGTTFQLTTENSQIQYNNFDAFCPSLREMQIFPIIVSVSTN